MEATAARRPPSRVVPPRHLLRLAGDERLVEYVRGASQPAFEVLYDRHHRAILAFCRHMLSDATEAEDAVQHVFMAAYRDLVGSEKVIQLKPWLYTIARNRCLTILRGRRETATDEVDAPSLENLTDTVQRRQDLQDLLRDVAHLPEDQRAALVLSEVGDVSHDEIAAVLGCPREKVKALVFQARSSLADSRKARDTDCAEIREQLATLRGGSLRRNSLRRHVKECPGCAAFAAEMRSQRKALAVALPVIPTLGLKENALAAAFGVGGTGAAVTAGTAAGGAAVAGGTGLAGTSAGAGALAAKVLVVAALAGGGGTAAVTALSEDAPKPASQRQEQTPAAPGTSTTPGGGPAPAAIGGQSTADEARDGDGPVKRRVRKRPHGSNAGGKRLAKGRDATKVKTKTDVAARKENRTEAQQEKKVARTERKQARKQAAAKKQASKRRAAAKAKPKQTSPKPARTPAPRPTPEPKPKPERTPAPLPIPTPEPTIEPEKSAGSNRNR